MHLNIRIELVEDGQHIALVDHGEQIVGGGFFTQEAFDVVQRTVSENYAAALVAFAAQIGAERVLAEQVADDLVTPAPAAA